MLKAIKQCIGWLDWKVVAGGLAVIALLTLCLKLPTLSMLAGLTPLLLIVVCLVPCLVPIALVRGAGRRDRIKKPTGEHE
jgi:hypothetical protein